MVLIGVQYESMRRTDHPREVIPMTSTDPTHVHQPDRFTPDSDVTTGVCDGPYGCGRDIGRTGYDQWSETTATAPLTTTIPPGAHVIGYAESISLWIARIFPSNTEYLAWYERQSAATHTTLRWVAGVLDKVDAGWPTGTIETAYATTNAQAAMAEFIRDITGRCPNLWHASAPSRSGLLCPECRTAVAR
jgi:hypothetical protein